MSLAAKAGVWQNLSDLIFSDIMMMVGQESLEELQKCRQVCKTWNKMITLMTKLTKDNIRRRAENMADQIRYIFINRYVTLKDVQDLTKVVTAASLAHHGLLEDMGFMVLESVDLSSVPAEHLAALASCVMRIVDINNVSNNEVRPILNNLNCSDFYISNQSLGSEETMALVRAMESKLEVLWLCRDVSLDIAALTQYSGQEQCL